MDPDKNEGRGVNGQFGDTAVESSNTLAGVTRREWFRTAAGGCAGLALGSLVDVAAVQASTQKLKLSDVNEFTTSCNFCSCGCGMVATVREGKLITMEGDFDHIVNRGSLCVKGISMFATHTSPNRLTTPRYRAAGSDHWEDISWDDAIAQIAKHIKTTRDKTFVAKNAKGQVVNRTPGIAMIGGCTDTNEFNMLQWKVITALGVPYRDSQARV